MRSVRAAAAVLAAAACHPARPALKPAPAAAAPAPAVPAAVPDAGIPDPSAALLEAARARRSRLERHEHQVEAEPADAARAIAQDAQACTGDAHRAWTARFPAAAAQLDGTRDPAQVYALVGPDGAEPLYLEAVCTAVWARMQGFTPLIERRTELMAAFGRVAQLAPALDGAGAERELGALYAALPAYAGGDLEAARKHLDAAVRSAPADPRNRLVLARTVAVKAQDRALFEEQLRLVAKGEDAVAAADAAALLQREDELFGPAEK